ncbi:MAG: transposase, partial [Gammaproteobacteria bacterium]|nr:transposase [Gammaproteobacteria bacterium]
CITAGGFDGLSDVERSLFGKIFPASEKRGRGTPPVPPRMILNSPLYVLITGRRRRDLPGGPQRASKSSGHRRLRSRRLDGTLNKLGAIILGFAENEGLIHWKSGAVDGSFSPGKGGGAEVAYGYKGKGVLIHLPVDSEGMPLSAVTAAANEDERKRVGPSPEKIEVKTGRPPKKPKRTAGDKGYDSQEPREFLKRKGIRPRIPRKRNAEKTGETGRNECSGISGRTHFFLVAEKISTSCRPTGKTASVFQFISFSRHHIDAGTEISGIGSSVHSLLNHI